MWGVLASERLLWTRWWDFELHETKEILEGLCDRQFLKKYCTAIISYDYEVCVSAGIAQSV